jgi:hypothetical protein
MPHEAVLSGNIPSDGVLDILREIEARRISGRLTFSSISADGSMEAGEVELIAGQIALDQDPLPDGTDPVERLLALRAGTFTVHQCLPALPISQGDERIKHGSLGVHIPADLMNYCEQSGLTGTLRLDRDSEHVELVYEAGELLAIRLDGRDDADVSHAFGWNEGSFRIEVNDKARGLVPDVTESDSSEPPTAREPTTQFVRPKRDDTGQFLRVLEVALSTIVESRERARPSTGPAPARAPVKSVRPRPQAPQGRQGPQAVATPSPKREREPTVRVVYLKPDDPTTAVRPKASHEQEITTGDKARETPVQHEEPSPRAKKKAEAHCSKSNESQTTSSKEVEAPMASTALAWTLTVATLAALFIGLLDRLSWPR